MKKTLFFLITLLSSFLLSSCKVNWFGSQIDVPWYVVAIPVCLIAVIGYAILMNLTFICPKCGTEFKPKWYQLSVCIHFGRERLAKCPKCGRKGFCKRKAD